MFILELDVKPYLFCFEYTVIVVKICSETHEKVSVEKLVENQLCHHTVRQCALEYGCD